MHESSVRIRLETARQMYGTSCMTFLPKHKLPSKFPKAPSYWRNSVHKTTLIGRHEALGLADRVTPQYAVNGFSGLSDS